jgi:hypothetical protein
MVSVLDMPVDDVLAAVEAAAARGETGAARELDLLLTEEAETADLGVISRLAAQRFVHDEGVHE